MKTDNKMTLQRDVKLDISLFLVQIVDWGKKKGQATMVVNQFCPILCVTCYKTCHCQEVTKHTAQFVQYPFRLNPIGPNAFGPIPIWSDAHLVQCPFGPVSISSNTHLLQYPLRPITKTLVFRARQSL